MRAIAQNRMVLDPSVTHETNGVLDDFAQNSFSLIISKSLPQLVLYHLRSAVKCSVQAPKELTQECSSRGSE